MLMSGSEGEGSKARQAVGTEKAVNQKIFSTRPSRGKWRANAGGDLGRRKAHYSFIWEATEWVLDSERL